MKIKKVSIDDNVAEILRQSTIDGCNLTLPPQQLDRDMYVKVNKIIELLGGKWVRGKKCHVFNSDVRDILNEALECGDVVDKKATYQFYETPANVINDLLDHLVINSGLNSDFNGDVLEPSAGHGAIAKAVKQLFPNAALTMVELDKEKIPVLKAIDIGDVVEGDFFAYKDKQFDVIVANPPFANKNDVKHVSHMIDLLKPGGSLVSIMSAGVKTNSDKLTKKLREIFSLNESAIIDIDEKAFKESGTTVNTIAIWFKKVLE